MRLYDFELARKKQKQKRNKDISHDIANDLKSQIPWKIDGYVVVVWNDEFDAYTKFETGPNMPTSCVPEFIKTSMLRVING